MNFTAKNLNRFLLFKLPSAYFTGVRVAKINAEKCQATVTHRWINQNPFHSMYFAVQAMAAELSTGALVMYHVSQSKQKISLLVAQNQSVFSKKATGKITFECEDGNSIKQLVQKVIETKEGQTLWVKSVGRNQEGVIVSEFKFEWTLKLK